jgi:prepilin-type N-terminal cleavage/methylation domain-containing protein
MKQARGFTLIELAIVLVIMTILIGGLAVPLSAQIQARRIAETRQILQEAREAVLGYAMTHHADNTTTNHHLPCPDINGDGREDRNSPPQRSCQGASGSLPWVDLGTAPQDAWGNRLRYEADPSFSNATTGFSGNGPLLATLQICTSHSCPTPLVAADVVLVLVSHGPNGWGAHNVNGNQLAAPTGADEVDNLDDPTNQIYVTRAPTKSDAAAGEFDDLVVWISRSRLTALICPTGSECNP